MSISYRTPVVVSALILFSIIGSVWWLGMRPKSAPHRVGANAAPSADVPELVRAEPRAPAAREVRREASRESERYRLANALHAEIVRVVEEYNVPMQGCDVSCDDERCAADLLFRTGNDAQLVGRIPLDRRLDAEFLESVDQADGSVVLKIRFRSDRVLATQQ